MLYVKVLVLSATRIGQYGGVRVMPRSGARRGGAADVPGVVDEPRGRHPRRQVAPGDGPADPLRHRPRDGRREGRRLRPAGKRSQSREVRAYTRSGSQSREGGQHLPAAGANRSFTLTATDSDGGSDSDSDCDSDCGIDCDSD
eukprot:9479068-Pyramimonas_sp.AAC.1